MDNLRARNNGLADQIGQAHLPLFFRLADAIPSISGRHSCLEALNPAIDVVHTLASKMLNIIFFTVVEWSSPKFQPAKVFHLAGRILEGNASLPFQTVGQATMDFLAS